jgi:P-type conjugative transfer ATPase TrbB
MILHHHEQQQRLHEKLRRELGPVVLAALDDGDVTEVMLNPDGVLWTESQRGGMRQTSERMSAIQAENLIGTVAAMLGTVVNAASPIVEGELPLDGNRFEGILPPVSTAPVFVIRKRPPLIYTLHDYVAAGVLGACQAEALRWAITARRNIVIAGGTASGKTTLANALIHEIVAFGEPTERLVILEDTRELRCAARNVVQLHTGDVADLTRLTRVTMRLRPDRIIVGEVRGPEALALLKAWNTGHPGGITTVHANSARAALMRLEALIQEAGVPAQPTLVAEAVDVIVFIARTPEGRRVRELVVVDGWTPAHGYRLEPITSVIEETPYASSHSVEIFC